ncbi:hypothetical protein G5I_12508 [Acromyrmex echinatior]|uniref:Uncharacterized protein n=1 Tax=Acromyrmex echinatior TaxID=103372 RepID=F4X2H8_ACREC|nr:hypothetical protein G5I_12508 [Acromyrmex echinatior]
MPCEIIRCTVKDPSEKYPFTRICGTANGILVSTEMNRENIPESIRGAVFCETRFFTLLYLATYDLYACTARCIQTSRGSACISIIGRSCAVTMRVTKADGQRNENGRWKANSGTRLRRDVVHGDVCRAPEFVDRATVTARLRFSLLHSKTVTLSSQSSPLEVHRSPIRALLSRRIDGATLATSFQFGSLYRNQFMSAKCFLDGVTLGIKTARFNPLQLASSSIRRAGAHFSPSSKKQKPLVTILMVTSASLVIPAVGGTG